MGAARHIGTAAALVAGRHRARAAKRLGIAREHAWLAVVAALVAVPLALRGPLPPDELRYLSVAWEMWSRGDFLVPHLNGVPYDEKGPLLFWLMHAGWTLFGVNDWWPRCLPGLFAVSSIVLARALSRALWPESRAAAAVVPWLLLGSFAWALYTQIVMFDLLLANCTLLGLLGLERAERGAGRGWVLVAAATALGLLTKGPVMLLHLAGPALAAPWWRLRPRAAHRAWYLRAGAALGVGIGVALAWAALAVSRGGAAYGADLIVNQTAGRLVESFAHARPWWFYVPLAPALLLPWSAWPAAWAAARRALPAAAHDRGARLLLTAIVPPLIVFSLMSGKQPHYVLPLVPPALLLLARALASHAAARVATGLPAAIMAAGAAAMALLPFSAAGERLSVESWSPLWGLVTAALILALAWGGPWREACKRMALFAPLVVLASEAGFLTANRPAYDASGAAAFVRTLQDAGSPIAHAGTYAGQFHFLGRLTEPLDVISKDAASAAEWAATHPHGYVVTYGDSPSATAVYRQPLRGEWLNIERAAQ